MQIKGVMDIVSGAVNSIRSRTLNHQFVFLIETVGNEHGEILNHTDVRWLSRGKVLKLFLYLREEINSFLKTKNRATTELQMQSDFAPLHFSDITDRLNCVNGKLQGKHGINTTMYDGNGLKT